MIKRGAKSGLALIATLWILVILLVIAAGFSFSVRTEVKLAENYGLRTRARLLALAGLHRWLWEVKNDETPFTAFEETWEQLDSALEDLPLETGSFRVEAEDENAKLDLNTATEEMLTQLLGDPELVDAILDWRDEDDQPRPFGAESDYYQSLDYPYNAKNGPFSTVEELLLVCGVTPELFYGEEALAGETALWVGETQTATETEEEIPPLRELFTVYSRDTNLDANGVTRLNLRTATKEQLQARLGEFLTEEEIEAILTYRDGEEATEEEQAGEREQPGGTEAEGAARPGATGPSGGVGMGGTRPGGTLGGGGTWPQTRSRQRPEGLSGAGGIAPSTGERPTGEAETPSGERPGGERPQAGRETAEEKFKTTGDLLKVPGLSREKVQEIIDFLPVPALPVIRGRVNLNTASQAVLLALPGMTEEAVQDIITYRESADGPFESVGELLQLNSVTEEMFARLSDLVTTRSYAFRVRAYGVIDLRPRQLREQVREEETYSLPGQQLERGLECVIAVDQTPIEPLETGEAPVLEEELPERQMQILYWRER